MIELKSRVFGVFNMSVKLVLMDSRIGRNIFRALHERKDLNDIDIVAINDLGDASTNAHY